MALINCPECNKEISDKAEACPSCGLPMSHLHTFGDISKNEDKTPKALNGIVLPETFTCQACKRDFPFKLEKCPHCDFRTAHHYKYQQPSPTVKPATGLETDTSIVCPKCKAKNSFTAGSKGFGLGKAAVGGLLLGPVGLLGGVIGSNKTVITCLKCGYKWYP